MCASPRQSIHTSSHCGGRAQTPFAKSHPNSKSSLEAQPPSSPIVGQCGVLFSPNTPSAARRGSRPTSGMTPHAFALLVERQNAELRSMRLRRATLKADEHEVTTRLSITNARIAIHLLISEAYRDDCRRHATQQDRRTLAKQWMSVMRCADDELVDEDGARQDASVVIPTLSCMYMWSENVCREFVYVDPSAADSYVSQRRVRMQHVLDTLPEGKYFHDCLPPKPS